MNKLLPVISTILLFPLLAVAEQLSTQSGISILSDNSVMSKEGTTHYHATLETRDGYKLDAERLITFGPIKQVSRALAYGNPVKFREVSQSGVVIYDGEATEAIYSRDESTITLKDYIVRDAAGNQIKSHNGVFKLTQ
jgi:lipopolysaccharide export system protein LptA